MSAKEPMVSVIIPVYNDAATLATAVRSVLAQTFQDFEIIIVDDGSTENISAALDGLHTVRLRLLRHAQNKGAAAARNTGIRHATGRYIALLDRDDIWMPDKLERQLKILEAADDHTKACCTSYLLLRLGDTRCEKRPLLAKEDWYSHLLWGCDLSPGSTLVVKRDCFEEMGLFDEDFRRLEDWDWLLRYAGRYSLSVIEDPLAQVNITSTSRVKEVVSALALMREKHLATAAAKSLRLKRRFLSALLLERAAIFYRERHLLSAAVFLTRSFFTSPFRNLAFYFRMVNHLSRLVLSSVPASRRRDDVGAVSLEVRTR